MDMEYKVVEMREGLLGGKMSGDKLEKVLNREARDGWRYKSLTSVDVKGRIGPGGVDGVLVVFERVSTTRTVLRTRDPGLRFCQTRTLRIRTTGGNSARGAGKLSGCPFCR